MGKADSWGGGVGLFLMFKFRRNVFVSSTEHSHSEVNTISCFILFPPLFPHCAALYLVMSDSFRPMDCSWPGSSVHGILQARILMWVAMPSSRGSFQLRDRTGVSCIAGGFFTG